MILIIIITKNKKANLEILKSSFSIIGAKVWNLIPPDWRNDTKAVFEKNICALLFNTLITL